MAFCQHFGGTHHSHSVFLAAMADVLGAGLRMTFTQVTETAPDIRQQRVLISLEREPPIAVLPSALTAATVAVAGNMSLRRRPYGTSEGAYMSLV